MNNIISCLFPAPALSFRTLSDSFPEFPSSQNNFKHHRDLLTTWVADNLPADDDAIIFLRRDIERHIIFGCFYKLRDDRVNFYFRIKHRATHKTHLKRLTVKVSEKDGYLPVPLSPDESKASDFILEYTGLYSLI